MTGTLENMPRQLEPGDVGSARLASLVAPLIVNPRLEASYWPRLRDCLIDLTIRMAREHTTWYSDQINPGSYVGLEELAELPLLTRQQVTENRTDFVADITTFAFATFTTGSTDQPPLMIERSGEEQLYYSNLVAACLDQLPDETTSAPLGLVGTNNSHGNVFQTRTRGQAFSVNFDQDAAFAKAAWLLNQEFQFPGLDSQISFIQGYFEQIHLLVLYLQQEGIQLPQEQIQSVSCYGMQIPSSRRSFVEDFFSSTVDDNYSLSEVHGFARYSAADQCYVYSPFAVAEVVDPWTCERVETGTGELLLTSLFPFTQRFPLIRYRTGDLVFTPGRVALGPLFQVRGRLNRAVTVAKNQVVCHEEVSLALESCADVARLKGGPSVIADCGPATGPSFELTSVDRSDSCCNDALVRVQLVERPAAHLDELARHLRLRILGQLPDTTRSILQQHPERLTIRLVPCKDWEREHFG